MEIPGSGVTLLGQLQQQAFFVGVRLQRAVIDQTRYRILQVGDGAWDTLEVK